MSITNINNPALLWPGGTIEDFSKNKVALTNSGVTFTQGAYGYDVGVFAGAEEITFASQPTDTVCWFDENGSHRAVIGGTLYVLNGRVTTSFTNPLAATSIGNSYTGRLSRCRYYNEEASIEQVKQIMDMDRAFKRPSRRPQPYIDKTTVPVLTDSTLVYAGLNASTVGSSDDASNKFNHGTVTGGSFMVNGGVTFSSGALSLPTVTFTTQLYTIFESDGINRYCSNGTTIWKNGVSGASLPVTITSTGFSGVTAQIADIELYNVAKDASFVDADYAKRVPNNNLYFKNA